MNKNITVYNKSGEELGKTFSRRATQLVLKGRADWHDSLSHAICLREEKNDMIFTEDVYMNNNGEPTKEYAVEGREESGYRVMHDKTDEIDSELYEMAKQNLTARSHLIVHWVCFLCSQILFLGIAMVALDNFYVEPYFIVLIDAAWFIGLGSHTAFYFTRISPDRLLKEYSRLSRMK